MRILVFLASGFEEIEALTVVDYLRRIEGSEVNLVSITGDKYVEGAHDIVVKADLLLEGIYGIDSYDGLVIPGGMPGASNLRDNKEVIEIVQKFHADKKIIAAICAGPIVLEEAKIVDNRKITSYPGFEEIFANSVYLEDNVVIDENLITARGPALAIDFTLAIAGKLVDEDKVNKLKRDILYL